ncbi:MAG: DUF481 domain-containing protein [Verrucomicrobia bacterium]|nr:DUF481 domain-containing protein [Verrucomicrobiota bacterium]
MMSGNRRGILRAWLMAVIVLAGVGAQAAEPAAAPHDTLVYKDGDRVQGHLVGREGNVIVFKSTRFGELRVAATDAVVIPADKAPEVAAKPAAPAPKPAAAPSPAVATAESKKTEKAAAAEREEAERMSIWERFSPSVLTAHVRKFFGPWHGRLALSTEVVSDTTDRNNSAVDATLKRKWERDEVQFNGRFDYSETNKVATTDVVKASGLWRHDFNTKRFAQYRPTAEWNRASILGGAPNDYLLLQQEIGVGFNLLSTPGKKLRAGVSENLFDVWNTAPVKSHSSRGVASSFEEVEWALPWRMTLTQRGVWYPVRSKADGWENRFELNKKLTETLSTSLRHEIRRNNPDGSAQDYTRLKLLFGLDF